MNRNGSLVVQDAKERDRERYPIVCGARLNVRTQVAIRFKALDDEPEIEAAHESGRA